MSQYGVFYAAETRAGRQPRHGALLDQRPELRWVTSRFGTALCGVHIAQSPESGAQGELDAITCRRCRQRLGLSPLPGKARR
jgi:hypothetical protein